jgi:hypothetical protein
MTVSRRSPGSVRQFTVQYLVKIHMNQLDKNMVQAVA